MNWLPYLIVVSGISYVLLHSLPHLFLRSPWPLVSLQLPPLKPDLHGSPTVLIGQWCLASCGAMGLSSVTAEALRRHAAKESLEVNSPWGEPLINGRQRMVINSSPFLFPSGGTVLRGSSSHARRIKTVLQDWATSHDETKQRPDQYHPLLCVLPPSLLHSPFALSCSPGTMLLSEAAAHKHLLQAQPFGEARVRTHHTNVLNTIKFACWLHVLSPIYLPHRAPGWMQ